MKQQKLEKLKEYKKSGNTFCPAIFLHRFVDTDKTSKLCCLDLNSLDNRLLDYNDPLYKQARHKSLNNEKIDQCHKCYESESQGIISLRQRSIEDIIVNNREDILFDNVEKFENGRDILPLWHDLRISNNCNLKCIMCGPQYSSTWADEEGIANKHLSFDADIEISPNTYKMQLAGGEPFMIKKFVGLLERIENTDCEVTVNTNATIVTRGLLDQLKRFKNTLIILSLDGYGELNEQIREKSKWKEIDKNIKIFQDNGFNLLVNTVVQRDNVNKLSKLGEYLESVNIDDWMLSRLFNPEHLRWEKQTSIDYDDVEKTLSMYAIQRNEISVTTLETILSTRNNNEKT